MVSIVEELNTLTPDAIVELFEFDVTPIIPIPTGSDSVYYTNSNVGNLYGILWDGNSYTPFPFTFINIKSVGDGSALERPTLSVSNINNVFFAIFLSLGDLSGVRVVRTITCYKFTDNGSEPNLLSYFSKQEYSIVRKMKQDKLSIEYELASALDFPNLKLPRRQILASKTTRNLYAPGVSRTRLRS